MVFSFARALLAVSEETAAASESLKKFRVICLSYRQYSGEE